MVQRQKEKKLAREREKRSTKIFFFPLPEQRVFSARASYQPWLGVRIIRFISLAPSTIVGFEVFEEVDRRSVHESLRISISRHEVLRERLHRLGIADGEVIFKEKNNSTGAKAVRAPAGTSFIALGPAPGQPVVNCETRKRQN